MTSARNILNDLFATAVAAVHPASCLPKFLPPPPGKGRLVMLAAGKGAGSMTQVAERHYLDAGFPEARLDGIAVTRHGYGQPTRKVPVIEAGHPIPDAAGLAAAEKTLRIAQGCTADDVVLALMSGGASANWIAPATGITLVEKQAVTRALLRSGANIGEINTVRKHLSRIKGGRLAANAAPARVITLAISDVPGDDPAVIGSGPTVPDPTTLKDARAIVSRYQLELPEAITRALNDPENESPKPADKTFEATEFHLIARPQDAFDAVKEKVSALGYEFIMLGDRLEGEASSVAAKHAKLARDLKAQRRRAIILSGGELTVTIRGKGEGGPNQEYALALATHLEGVSGIAALAGDTDGTDGGTGRADDPAGAYVDASTGERARAIGLDPAAFLQDNNSTVFFRKLGDLLTPGPTYTNVNDFRAILIDKN